MKTLCVAVVLSLISVCQPASLACEKLVQKVDKGPDLSGRWHFVAISTEFCLASTLLNAVFWPSIAMDITSKDTPNVHDSNFKVKMYGFCVSESEPFLYVNNSFFGIDSNNAPKGEADVLLQTGCPDCLVVKGVDVIGTLLLLSRRKTVTAAELKEFETQADCLGWSKPQVLNAEHGYENCKSLDGDMSDDDVAIFVKHRWPSLAR